MPTLVYSIKKQLFQHCLDYINTRIDTIEQAMAAAQASANEETKSSAGDKYETGRAMAQIDKELNTKQLLEAQKQKNELLKIDITQKSSFIQVGSLVKTTQGNYFLAISAGKIILENTTYFAVSPASPIGSQLLKLSVGSEITFNGKLLIINEIE